MVKMLSNVVSFKMRPRVASSSTFDQSHCVMRHSPFTDWLTVVVVQQSVGWKVLVRENQELAEQLLITEFNPNQTLLIDGRTYMDLKTCHSM